MTSLHRAVAALATAFLVVTVTQAVAHEEAAVHALAVITDVTPSVDGFEVRVAQLTAPVLIVTNNTRETAVILGEEGEPFLRITDRGVETNLQSPTSYRAADPTGERPVPDDLDPEAAPEWIKIAPERSWSWFDPRASYSPGAPDWSIPARIGGDRVTINGSYEPIDGHGLFRTTFDDPVEIEDLELRLFDGLVPAIFVRNRTDEVLHVPGRAGEPFLRVGPRGVFGNKKSPDFYASGSQTVRAVPKGADPLAKPRWVRLSANPSWHWLEYRARLPAAAYQRTSLGTEPKTVLLWTTPLRLGEREFDLAGHVEWRPPSVPQEQEEDSALRAWIPALLVGIATVSLFLYLAKTWANMREP